MLQLDSYLAVPKDRVGTPGVEVTGGADTP